jgi:hypothetical protein
VKNILEKIKLLNTSQAIIIAAIIISTTFIISKNTYKISNLFCGEECKLQELKKAKDCSKVTARRAWREQPAYIKNDIYKKCLATKN